MMISLNQFRCIAYYVCHLLSIDILDGSIVCIS